MPKTISKSKKAVKTSSVKRKRVAAPKKKGVENCIELRGVRQNNLKGFDLDLPLGKFIVVTGASGSGKSSLAFQTLYAEGQRRYLETFSAYTRQFFERMDKPQVDSIKGIPPAIALEQNNGVRSTRSTVGTITEINDYLKILFARLAKGYCPKTGVEVKPDTVDSILGSLKGWSEEPILVTFPVPLPETSEKKGAALVADLFEFLQAQGYLRVLIFGEVYRCDEPKSYPKKTLPAVVDVIQDRVAISKKKRLSEAIEAALALGKGRVAVVDEKKQRREFSSDWHCPESGITLHPPVSGLFSYNHPLGACPKCRGFGRVIGIDLEKAIPDPSLSIEGRVITAFGGERGEECQQDLLRCAKMEGIDVKLPFEELPKKEQQWVLYGEGDDPEETWKMGRWYGVKGFFDWMESKAYKMHVRVFLSRYRAYTKCGDCRGQRLQPQALCFRVEGKTLPELWQMPVSELLSFIEGLKLPSKKEDRSLHLVHEQILSRLKYMSRVGLAYLDLDRPTRSLSGGELQRVNLTTCLGASLTGTLFVLDEPSIGLHPRDTARLIEILHELRQRGNTLLVVEHEEAIMRAAEHIVEIGPERGAKGGELVYSGEIEGLLSKKGSLTADYLSGRKAIELPAQRRTSKKSIKIRGASVHNLKSLDVDIPLRVLCCLTGVSGSGKSTLVHEVLYRNLLAQRGEDLEEEPARIKSLSGAGQINKVILVDQSTIARTPRSTPAVYLKVFDRIRKIFSKTEMAKDRGLNPGYFSFNSSEGR